MVLDDDDLIRRANDKAVAMGFVSGTTLAIYIVDLMEKFDRSRSPPPKSRLYSLEFQHGGKYACEF